MVRQHPAKIIGFMIITFVLYTVISTGVIFVQAMFFGETSYAAASVISGVINFIVLFIWNRFLNEVVLDKSFTKKDMRGSRNAKLIILILIFAILLSMALNSVFSIVVTFRPDALFNEVSEQLFSGTLWQIILANTVLAPICEEFIFRGSVYAGIRTICLYRMGGKATVILSAVISALAFGVIHLNVTQGIYAFIMGLVLAFAYEYTGRLWVSCLIHMLANFVSVIRTYSPLYEKISDSIPALAVDAVVLFAVAVVVVAVFVRIHRSGQGMSLRQAQ